MIELIVTRHVGPNYVLIDCYLGMLDSDCVWNNTRDKVLLEPYISWISFDD